MENNSNASYVNIFACVRFSWRACALRLCKLLSTVKTLFFLTRDFLHVRSEVMQITCNCQNSIVFNA